MINISNNYFKSISIIIFSLSITMGANNSNSVKEIIINDEWFAEINNGEYVLNCRIGGMENGGETVILLHGFPETSYMWIRLMDLLVKKGYRVIAPDQRGYSPKARPTLIKEYTLKHTVSDVLAIVNAYKLKRFHLVGHDWGSSVGWAFIAKYPDMMYSWTSLSIPHMRAFQEAYNNDFDQKEKSKYIGFFNMPFFPELYMSFNNYKNLKRVWKVHGEEEINAYLNVFRQRGALRSALNWYRANIGNRRKPSDYIQFGNVEVPTLFIWGNMDMAIGRKSVELSEKYMNGPYNFVELYAGHWLIQEEFDKVSNEIIKHLKKYSSSFYEPHLGRKK
ncbi:MAG: alpha/beta hydrolase [Candidatus Neomarinimicrobiota bacterium]|nr:alpha/beta hydrolase [Candidatus Neomarinimicrobiota bacterium]MEC9273192.1 alpha/beta hydrolase [Candidatus Neomarinimicrobiota bacterium]